MRAGLVLAGAVPVYVGTGGLVSLVATPIWASVAAAAAAVLWCAAWRMDLALRLPRPAWLLAAPLTGAATAGVSMALTSFLPSEGQPLIEAELATAWPLVIGVIPLLEELLFRGVLFGALPRRRALVVTSALFAVLHGTDPVVLLSVFVAALAWGALRALSGSVWPGVVAHVVQNALAVYTALSTSSA